MILQKLAGCSNENWVGLRGRRVYPNVMEIHFAQTFRPGIVTIPAFQQINMALVPQHLLSNTDVSAIKLDTPSRQNSELIMSSTVFTIRVATSLSFYFF